MDMVVNVIVNGHIGKFRLLPYFECPQDVFKLCLDAVPVKGLEFVEKMFFSCADQIPGEVRRRCDV